MSNLRLYVPVNQVKDWKVPFFYKLVNTINVTARYHASQSLPIEIIKSETDSTWVNFVVSIHAQVAQEIVENKLKVCSEHEEIAEVYDALRNNLVEVYPIDVAPH
jgi:uncharacterized membrane protein